MLVRAGEAERLESIGHFLLADSSATHGALSSHRIALGPGAAGAVPHRHDKSSELFFILDGKLDVLLATTSSPWVQGDLLVVPPGLAHAFGAHAGSGAEALIIIAPGVERFDYFRHVDGGARAGSRGKSCWPRRTVSTRTSPTVPPGTAPARPIDRSRTPEQSRADLPSPAPSDRDRPGPPTRCTAGGPIARPGTGGPRPGPWIGPIAGPVDRPDRGARR